MSNPTRETKVIDVSQIRLETPMLSPKVIKIIETISQGGQLAPVHLTPLGTGQFVPVDGAARAKVTAHKLLGIPLIVARFSKKMRRDVM